MTPIICNCDFETGVCNAPAHCKALGEVEKLRRALREIDDLAIQHVKGGIGKAQKIARCALTKG